MRPLRRRIVGHIQLPIRCTLAGAIERDIGLTVGFGLDLRAGLVLFAGFARLPPLPRGPVALGTVPGGSVLVVDVVEDVVAK